MPSSPFQGACHLREKAEDAPRQHPARDLEQPIPTGLKAGSPPEITATSRSRLAEAIR